MMITALKTCLLIEIAAGEARAGGEAVFSGFFPWLAFYSLLW